MRKLGILLGIILMFGGTAMARELMQGDACTIPSGDTVSGTLFVLCRTLSIEGEVDGNLIGAAVNAEIHGTIHDDVYLFGGQTDIYGDLGGDLAYIGPVLNVHPRATFTDDRADLFNLTLSTDSRTDIPGGIIAVGYQLLLRGDVGREVSYWGSALEIDGEIGGNLIANVGDSTSTDGTAQLEVLFLPLPMELDLVNSGLRVTEGSDVLGELRYTAPTPGIMPAALESKATFSAVNFQVPISLSDEELLIAGVRRYGAASVREFVTLTVVGGLGLFFVPQLMQSPISNLRRRPLTSLGVGVLTFILSFPVVVIAVVMSVLVLFAISLLRINDLVIAGAVILGMLDIGGATVFYFIAIFVARSIVCLALGRLILRSQFQNLQSAQFLYASLALGALIIAIVVSMPVFGWVVNALILFLGLGAIVNLVQAQLRRLRDLSAAGPVTTVNGMNGPPSFLKQRFPADRLPPANDYDDIPVDVDARPSGMENLPPGFTWWEDEG